MPQLVSSLYCFYLILHLRKVGFEEVFRLALLGYRDKTKCADFEIERWVTKILI